MRRSEIAKVPKKQRHSDHGEENKLPIAYTITRRTFGEWEGLIILMNIEEKTQ